MHATRCYEGCSNCRGSIRGRGKAARSQCTRFRPPQRRFADASDPTRTHAPCPPSPTLCTLAPPSCTRCTPHTRFIHTSLHADSVKHPVVRFRPGGNSPAELKNSAARIARAATHGPGFRRRRCPLRADFAWPCAMLWETGWAARSRILRRRHATRVRAMRVEMRSFAVWKRQAVLGREPGGSR